MISSGVSAVRKACLTSSLRSSLTISPILPMSRGGPSGERKAMTTSTSIPSGAWKLTSEWRTDTPRPRKFYRVSAEGEALLRALLDEWQALSVSMGKLR